MAKSSLSAIFESFAEQIFEHLGDKSDDLSRPDKRGRGLPDDDPALQAMRQMESFYGALSGRGMRSDGERAESKSDARARRYAEKIIARLEENIFGVADVLRSESDDGLERFFKHVETQLQRIAQQCANRFFTDSDRLTPHVRLGAARSQLRVDLERYAIESRDSLKRSIALQKRTLDQHQEMFDLEIAQAEIELFPLNRSLQPPVTFDRQRLVEQTVQHKQQAIARLDQDEADAREQLIYRLRQFEAQMESELAALAAGAASPATVSPIDAVAGVDAKPVKLDRPVAFATLAADYEEDAVALYRSRAEDGQLRSRLGGLPKLPVSLDWPCNAFGIPLHFIAQIDVGELPWVPPTMPNYGTLLFFMDLCEDLCPDGDDGLSVIFDASSSNRLAAFPDDLPRIGGLRFQGAAAESQNDPRIMPGYGLAMASVRSVPDPLAFDDNAYSLAKYADYCAAFPDYKAGQFEAVTGAKLISGHLHHHQMFGYVSSAQTPLGADSQIVTLLQIVTDEDYGIIIGDRGSLDFRISLDALARGEWNKVKLVHVGH